MRSRRPTPSYTFLGHEEEQEEEKFIQELTPSTRRTPSATRRRRKEEESLFGGFSNGTALDAFVSNGTMPTFIHC